MSDAATQAGQVLDDAAIVLRLLRSGDTLYVQSDGRWFLLNDEREVSPLVAQILRAGGYFLDKFGGRLVPGCDMLPGCRIGLSQTWEWHDAASEKVS